MAEVETLNERARAVLRQAIQRRRDAGESRAKIAEAVGVVRSTIWKWEQGQIPDSLGPILHLIASAPAAEPAQREAA